MILVLYKRVLDRYEQKVPPERAVAVRAPLIVNLALLHVEGDITVGEVDDEEAEETNEKRFGWPLVA